jgi:hypothetical protein
VAQGLVTELAALGDSYSRRIPTQTASQKIALLFKSSISVSNVQLIAGSNAGSSGLRKALKANVRIGNFDFIVIAVHMKAGRPTNGSNQDPHVIRNQQATAIANFISNAILGNEKDVLLIGDYNMVPGEDDENFARISPGAGANEFLRFISTESLSGQTSHISNCSPFGGNLLDGFAISKTFTQEFIGNTLKIIPFTDTNIFSSETGTAFNCTTYKGFISDHLPLIARFRANDPDDD